MFEFCCCCEDSQEISHVIDIFNSEAMELSIMQLSFETFSYVAKFDICVSHLYLI